MNEENEEIIVNKPFELEILKTDEDKYGNDINAMSNFFDDYICQLTQNLQSNSAMEVLHEIPISDIGIIGEVVQYSEAVMTGEFCLLPDFDHLPEEIKEKLKEGTYTVGESRQVDGNLRAVILDEEGVRVKDITLKKVRNDPGTLETARSITNQLQMRQIAAKLDYIQNMQEYQIDRDRDRDIKTPFFDARDYIVLAQTSESEEARIEYFNKASEVLTSTINAVCTDMGTTAEHIERMTARPIFQNRRGVKRLIGFLTTDLRLFIKFVGVQLQIYDYLGDTNASKQIAEKYQHTLQDFFEKEIGDSQQPAVMLLHNYYPYTVDNLNSWYDLKMKMEPVLNTNMLLAEEKPIYFVSVEEIEDGKD